MSERIGQGFRLSPQQRRLWLLREAGGATGYRSRCVVSIAGRVERELLRAALRGVVQRHDTLRTWLTRLPGMVMPVQVVAAELEPLWLEEPPAEEPLFESSGGPMVKAWLQSLGPEEHLLHLNLAPHCADRASFEVLVRHLAACYEDGPAKLGGVRYAQFAEWQNRMLEAASGEDHSGLWGEGARTLPFRLPLETSNGFAPATLPQVVTEIPTAELASAARATGASPEGVLLACWQVLLWRFLGERNPLVAELYEGRPEAVLSEAVGVYEKWLPLTCEIAGARPFPELARAAQSRLEEVRELAASVSWPEREEPPSSSPPFPALGIEFRSPSPPRRAAGAVFSIEQIEACSDRFEVKLSCLLGEDRTRLVLAYDGGRFRPEDIKGLGEGLQALLRSVLANVSRTVGELSLGGEAAMRLDVPEAAPAADLVHRRFRRWAELQPDAPALVYEDQVLSYRELRRRVNRLAHHLRGLGVGTDTRVALCLHRSADLITGLLGILVAGGAYSPLDPSAPLQRLSFALEDLRAPVLVTDSQLAGDLGVPFSGRTVRIDADLPDSLPEDEPEDLARPESLAYVIFTSGSTGKPKGVAVEHRHLASYVEAILQRLDLPAGSGYATVSTVAADLGNTSIFPALAGGGCLHLVSEERATDPAALAGYFERHRVDCLKIVPSHLDSLLSYDSPRGVLPASRLVLGGESSRREWFERLRGVAPEGLVLLNHYGPTETTVGVLTHRSGPEPLDPRCATLPLGHPLGGALVYLLDRQLNPLPPWVPGEVYIGGPTVSRGYLDQPAATSERFVPDPFAGEPGVRMYRTGDLARRLSDGSVEFLGRVDSQIKFHGFRIELEEIRLALNRHPRVRDSVVRVLQDENGRAVLVAYYVSSREVETAELRQVLAERILEETLPNFFMHLKRLPLTLNGKVNTAALPDLEEVRSKVRRRFVPPSNPVEELLAGIWSEILGVPRVSVKDSFFELGGHSLLATQLVSRVRQVLQVEIALRDLFERPTVAGLAERIGQASREGGGPEAPPIVPVPRDGDLPLSHAQERLWIMHQLSPENPAYNVRIAIRLRGELRVWALQRSFEAVVRRHEALRTRFPSEDGRPRQVIDPPTGRTAPEVDLSELPEEVRQAEARRLGRDLPRIPFDLARGPLVRSVLVRMDPRDHVVILALHHIVSDGWSMGVLVREIMALYGAFSAGAPSPLPPLPVQYADFACWQRGWLQGEVLDELLSYWRTRLSGAPSEMPLPLDRPRAEGRSLEGQVRTIPLPAELSTRVDELGRKEGTTLFMTLLAAFKALLLRTMGQEDVVVGTDVANRNRIEIEGLIGFFINNLVLRTDLAGDPSFRDLLRRVRATCLGAYAHQDLPFDRLVKELRVSRDPSRTPLFNVLFVVQNAAGSGLELPGLALEPFEVVYDQSKFDLAVFVVEGGERLLLRWNFRSDLFDEATIERLAARFERLLEHAVRDPEARLSQLEMLTETERKQQAMETKENRQSRLAELGRSRRRSVDLSRVSPIRTGYLAPGQTLPLVVQPALSDVDLIDWAASSRDFLEEQLFRHGAILFRGFGLSSVADFERFARSICPDLYGEYGDLPRDREGERIYQSTPYPPDKAILFHNESSHMSRWPMKQMFFCVQAARSGGETPIVDGRQIYSRLAPEVRDRFEREGLLYIRNFIEGLDVSWQQFFKTTDRAEVERRCREASLEFEWNGDRLKTKQACQAVTRHPRTGETVFFNQVQLHHPAFLEPEVRSSVLSLFGEDAMPRDVRFGDGSVIPDEVMNEIAELYWEQSVGFPWQEGDVLLLDNMLVAHARNPFEGPRKIVVAMGELTRDTESMLASPSAGDEHAQSQL